MKFSEMNFMNSEQQMTNQNYLENYEKKCKEKNIKITKNSLDQFIKPQFQWELFQIDQAKPFSELLLITKPKLNLTQQQQSSSTSEDKHQDAHKCQLCQKKFSTSKALGGHMSKKHKGTSKKYQQKVATHGRNTQTRLNRNILNLMISKIFPTNQ